MNRPWQASLNKSILSKIREEIPSAVLRTSLIVGFPGEKKEHFEHLLEFLDRYKFDHVGVFIFSPEEGTAAFDLSNKISPEVAEARKDNVISVQQNISYKTLYRAFSICSCDMDSFWQMILRII